MSNTLKGQLARWLEELCQFDMVIEYYPGCKISNTDGLSHTPEEEYCKCYEAGVDIPLLPCEGCKYCTYMQEEWSQFEDDYDDDVPIAMRSVQVANGDMEADKNFASEVEGDSTSWWPQYTSKQLQERNNNRIQIFPS